MPRVSARFTQGPAKLWRYQDFLLAAKNTLSRQLSKTSGDRQVAPKSRRRRGPEQAAVYRSSCLVATARRPSAEGRPPQVSYRT